MSGKAAGRARPSDADIDSTIASVRIHSLKKATIVTDHFLHAIACKIEKSLVCHYDLIIGLTRVGNYHRHPGSLDRYESQLAAIDECLRRRRGRKVAGEVSETLAAGRHDFFQRKGITVRFRT